MKRPIPIEAGKRYVLRNGYITSEMEHKGVLFKATVYALKSLELWYADGSYLSNVQHQYDVVEEFVPARVPLVHATHGKRFRTRGGHVTTPLEAVTGGVWARIDGRVTFWPETGLYAGKDHEYDLVEMVPDFELKHGARYVTRDGRTTGPLYNVIDEGTKRQGYRWYAMVPWKESLGESQITWVEDGRWIDSPKPHDLDLVREATKGLIWGIEYDVPSVHHVSMAVDLCQYEDVDLGRLTSDEVEGVRKMLKREATLDACIRIVREERNKFMKADPRMGTATEICCSDIISRFEELK